MILLLMYLAGLVLGAWAFLIWWDDRRRERQAQEVFKTLRSHRDMERIEELASWLRHPAGRDRDG